MNTLDLYEEQFDPILRFDDTHKRRDLSTVPDMESIANLITWADHIHLYLQFGGAVCLQCSKGFIDRVFTAGFAYSYWKKRTYRSFTGKISLDHHHP